MAPSVRSRLETEPCGPPIPEERRFCPPGPEALEDRPGGLARLPEFSWAGYRVTGLGFSSGARGCSTLWLTSDAVV